MHPRLPQLIFGDIFISVTKEPFVYILPIDGVTGPALSGSVVESELARGPALAHV